MNFKNPIITAILSSLIIISCSSLDIVGNETDLYKDKLEADGKELRSATPIQDFFPKFFDSTNSSILNSITFEVALTKFSIMPIMTADISSGIITTDWFSSTNKPNERFKFNIIIKDDNMTEDSIIINMFKELLDDNVWKTTTANSDTAVKIKQNILNKAIQIKTAAELS
tara:strand:+ start:250 stop:759 length:510 start_codon:yes stop_codon:yes gene_type:complete